MTWLIYILTGIIIGMLIMYLLMKGSIGNDYTVSAKVKNKKSTITDNELYTQIDFENQEKKPKLRKNRKRLQLFKKLKQRKNGSN